MDNIQPNSLALQGRSSGARAVMQGAVPDFGVRAVDLLRESARYRDVLRRAGRGKLYHTGWRKADARATLADANETGDWCIYAEFAQRLIVQTRPLYYGT